jgi:hypothetical protein
MDGRAEYLHLPPGAALPDVARLAPFRAVVVIEADVAAEWRSQACTWLVDSGCLYMCAWGRDCSIWDDVVDWVNLEEFDFGDIPDERFVMTTWHQRESLGDAMFFVKHCAIHPTVDLENTLVVHIADAPDAARLLGEIAAA